MCESRPAGCLIFLLVLWLLLAFLREVFDLIGKLWIPVFYNLLQILSCISGLFAAYQHRVSLLVALSLSSLISLAYNVLIILWYHGVFGDRTRPLLSAGLPYSYSFFLRYTPICQSYFNLTSSQWSQKLCILPYYNVESLQALIHAIISVLTMILSLALACSRRQPNSECISDRKTKTVSIDFSGTGSGSACLMGNMGEINLPSRQLPSKVSESISSGYLNSSYESPEMDVAQAKAKNSNRNYERHCGRNNRSKRLPKTPSTSAMYQDTVPAEPVEDLYGIEPSRPNPSTYGTGYDTGLGEKKPTRDVSIEESSVSSDATKDAREGIPSYSKIKQRSGSVRSFNAPTYESLQAQHRRRQSQDHLSHTPNDMDDGKSEFKRDDRRGSVSNLISFDPKSSTLIRVKEHIDDDDGESTLQRNGQEESNVYREVYMCPKRSQSQESVPSIEAPVLSRDLRISTEMDSTHPSSSATSGPSPDWNEVGISHPKTPPTTTIPSRSIGYDPALCDVQPPVPIHRVAPPPPPLPTAFPVEHQRRNSHHATSLSTAIPLMSNASTPTRLTSTQIGHPDVGQRLMAYSSVPEERERSKSSVFPSSNNGLLV